MEENKEEEQSEMGADLHLHTCVRELKKRKGYFKQEMVNCVKCCYEISRRKNGK